MGAHAAALDEAAQLPFDLAMEEGDSLALLGRNGMGKTTLIRSRR